MLGIKDVGIVYIATGPFPLQCTLCRSGVYFAVFDVFDAPGMEASVCIIASRTISSGICGSYLERVGNGGIGIDGGTAVGIAVRGLSVVALQRLVVDEAILILTAHIHLDTRGVGCPAVAGRRGTVGGADGLGSVAVVGDFYVGGAEAADRTGSIAVITPRMVFAVFEDQIGAGSAGTDKFTNGYIGGDVVALDGDGLDGLGVGELDRGAVGGRAVGGRGAIDGVMDGGTIRGGDSRLAGAVDADDRCGQLDLEGLGGYR